MSADEDSSTSSTAATTTATTTSPPTSPSKATTSSVSAIAQAALDDCKANLVTTNETFVAGTVLKVVASLLVDVWFFL
jgi:hypothetical protein